MIEKKPLHPMKVTVWCGFWAGSMIRPYFFENDIVTVNCLRYREMNVEFLLPELENIDLEDM